MSNDGMKRIQCTSVTSTLAEAMEHADDMANVLVLAWHKGDVDKEKGSGRLFSDSDLTIADCALMVLQFQHWLAEYSTDDGDGDEEDD
jgi:hypothetical protein